MQKKLSLDQTKKYEQYIATHEIAYMLVDFIKGKKHYHGIGCEQGNVDTWDDLVIEKDSNYYIHVQVKRQIASDFGDTNDTCIRNTITRLPRLGQPRDLSPFDKSIKALGDWLNNPTNNIATKEFWFELPEKNTEIKPGLKILYFYELCEIQYIHNVTTTSDLDLLAQSSNNVKNCFDWLTTWCDFQDWAHIIKMLPILKIKNSGLETDIRQKTEEKLKEVFQTDKAAHIHDKIHSFVHFNTTFAGDISPRSILEELKMYLLPNISTWTQFEKNGTEWNIYGIHDIESINHIERPEKVIPELWNNNRQKELKVNATTPTFNTTCKMSESLLRLAVHKEGGYSQFKDNINWKNLLNIKTGGTIGISNNDIESVSIYDNTEPFTSSEYKNLASISVIEGHSKQLENSMDNVTWEIVKNKVDDKIINMEINSSSELRDAVEMRWNIWKSHLNSNPDEYKILFKNMLHPNAEGSDICAEMRIGSKTVGLLSDGLFFLLIISVTLDVDNHGDWFNIDNKTISTISMTYWSGKVGNRRIKRIFDDRNTIIGEEKSDILLLPQIDASPSELFENSIAENIYEKNNNLATGHQPFLIVSRNNKLINLIEKGNINDLSNYLKQLSRTKAKERQHGFWQSIFLFFA